MDGRDRGRYAAHGFPPPCSPQLANSPLTTVSWNIVKQYMTAVLVQYNVKLRYAEYLSSFFFFSPLLRGPFIA